MVSINYSSREVCCKIVYYGPGLSGKTTNLQYIHSKVPQTTRGNLISLATEADRTLYFDFLPINIGNINGLAAKFQLYTVPGQVYYNATRKLVLRGVDGLVFVADSQPDKMDENIESLTNLEENLREYGYNIDDLPMVIQYNKRDIPGVMSVEELHQKLNPRGWPHFEASATVGNGVFDTLKLIIKIVLDKAKSSSGARPQPVATAQPSAPAEPAASQPVAQEPPAPVPEQPVAAAASAPAAAVDSSPTPVAVSASPAESAQEKPAPEQYRPFPGSHNEEQPEKKPSAAGFTPAATVESSSAPMARHAIDSNGTESGEEGDMSRPLMAPSLKRRGSNKKRGFFKKLFGIK